MTHHDQSLRQYLLSQLGESESAALEADLLEDSELFERTDAIRGEIMMDLADGKLPLAERIALEERLEASPRGVDEKRFFETLSGRLVARASSRPTSHHRRRMWPQSPLASALLAAALTFVASAAILGPRWETGPVMTATEGSPPAVTPTAAVSPVMSVFIVEPLTRSAGPENAPTIAPATELVGLWLAIPAAGDAFRVSVLSEGRVILSLDDLELVEQTWGTYVAVELELEPLPRAPLELLLEEARGSEWVDVASYSVRLAES
ncbi:MAG: hypothetical protein AAGF23_01915 [Acidobacteriota bacterium]